MIYIGEHVVQQWHRATMPCGIFENHDLPDKPMRRAGPGFSTRLFAKGEQHTGRFISVYAAISRITGEVGCCHLEVRLSGVKSLRRIGIHHPSDLLDFDFKWHFAKYIRLYELDYERLGRYYRNRRSGGKCKKSHITRNGKFTYNSDHRLGCAIYRSYAVHDSGYDHRSLQRFVDTFKRGPYLRKVPTLFFISMGKSNTSSETIAVQPFPESFDAKTVTNAI